MGLGASGSRGGNLREDEREKYGKQMLPCYADSSLKVEKKKKVSLIEALLLVWVPLLMEMSFMNVEFPPQTLLGN